MATLKKIGLALLVIVFPLGLIYCIVHTLGKEFSTFLGGICLLMIGILIGIYIVEPQILCELLNNIIEFFAFHK